MESSTEMKGLFSVAALALVLHGARLAHAVEEGSEPTPAQVRTAAEAFDRGREAYKTEDYVEAAEQFESADANAPSAAALELAIRARDKAGQLDRAATLAALALTRHPDDPNIQKIAPPIVERAKAELFELDVKCDEACEVTVAGKLAPGGRATARALFLAPGHYNVRAGWSGDRSLSKSIDGARGEPGSVDFTAPEVVAPPPAVVAPVTPPPSEKPADEGAHSKSGKLPPTAFWVGVGLTAVLGGTTIWSGIDTKNNPGADAVRDACKTVDSSGAHSTECNTLYDEGRSHQQRTNVLLGVTAGVGIATAVVGAFFTDWGGSKKSEAEAATARPKGFSVQPWVAIGSGASVGALGRF
ncbi:MAG TPA: hypothetical protein VFK05_23755 [Polyangiaceae bacterium]|nr:hypothetical protein [Polyangiaceae bacterium]